MHEIKEACMIVHVIKVGVHAGIAVLPSFGTVVQEW